MNDKDGISAAIVIAQLIDELKQQGKTFDDYLDEIGKEFGSYFTDQISIRFTDLKQIAVLFKRILDNPPKEILGAKLESLENLSESKDLNTPGIRLKYAGGIRVIVRPSGTEPKLKCYIETVRSEKNESKLLISQIKEVLTKVLS